jgi:hypothetical protein
MPHECSAATIDAQAHNARSPKPDARRHPSAPDAGGVCNVLAAATMEPKEAEDVGAINNGQCFASPGFARPEPQGASLLCPRASTSDPPIHPDATIDVDLDAKAATVQGKPQMLDPGRE